MTNMAFFGYHGVFPEEQKLGQRFFVDVELHLDLRDAAESDDLTASVDYGEVYELVKQIVEGSACQLIERVGGKICKEVLERFPLVERICVEVKKPEAPIAGLFDCASVRLDRCREATR